MGFLGDVGVPLSGIGYRVAGPFLGMVCLRVYPEIEYRKIRGVHSQCDGFIKQGACLLGTSDFDKIS